MHVFSEGSLIVAFLGETMRTTSSSSSSKYGFAATTTRRRNEARSVRFSTDRQPPRVLLRTTRHACACCLHSSWCLTQRAYAMKSDCTYAVNTITIDVIIDPQLVVPFGHDHRRPCPVRLGSGQDRGYRELPQPASPVGSVEGRSRIALGCGTVRGDRILGDGG